MTREERNDKLKHFIACLKCEVSGKCCNDNCSTQYDAGNMGEIIENLETISKALEQEPILDKITEIIEPLRHLPIGEMSDIEWDILRVIDKYRGKNEDKE